MSEDERIDADDRQRDHKHHQQGQIFAQNHLNGGDRQRIQQLVGLLAALLRDDAHGQNGDNRRIDDAAEAEHILKVAHGRLQVIQHGANAHDHQQKRAEYIGSEGLEIGPQFMFEYSSHGYASFRALVFSPVLDSVSSMNTSSSVPFFSAISRIILSLAVKAL